MAYVLIVDIDIDKISQRVPFVIEVLAQLRMFRSERFQGLARGLCFDFGFRTPTRILPERGRDRYCDNWHCSTPFKIGVILQKDSQTERLSLQVRPRCVPPRGATHPARQ